MCVDVLAEASLSLWRLSCHPNIFGFTLIGVLVVLLKVFAHLKVVRDFPAHFTHRFFTRWTVHILSIANRVVRPTAITSLLAWLYYCHKHMLSAVNADQVTLRDSANSMPLQTQHKTQ